jgi:hypothetical protein
LAPPVAASLRAIPPYQKKQNEQSHLRIFKGFFLAVRLSLLDQKFTETGREVMTDLTQRLLVIWKVMILRWSG